MKHALVLAAVATALVATPVFAAPPAKRPLCQVGKVPARDARRVEPCRRPTIPPVIDPTPMFLASTAASPAAVSGLT